MSEEQSLSIATIEDLENLPDKFLLNQQQALKLVEFGARRALATVPSSGSQTQMPLAEFKEWAVIIREAGMAPAGMSPKEAEAICVGKMVAGFYYDFDPFMAQSLIHYMGFKTKDNGAVGKFELSAEGRAAIIKSSGYDFVVKSLTNDACTIEFYKLVNNDWKAIGTVTFTYEDAELAGLPSRKGSLWKTYRKDMLYAATLRRGWRRLTPELNRGPMASTESKSVPDKPLLDVPVSGDTDVQEVAEIFAMDEEPDTTETPSEAPALPESNEVPAQDQIPTRPSDMQQVQDAQKAKDEDPEVQVAEVVDETPASGNQGHSGETFGAVVDAEVVDDGSEAMTESRRADLETAITEKLIEMDDAEHKKMMKGREIKMMSDDDLLTLYNEVV